MNFMLSQCRQCRFMVSLRQGVRTLRGSLGSLDSSPLGGRESVVACSFNRARRVISEMTWEFIVESGDLLFFFGVSITLVVLKGVLLAHNELHRGEYGDSELEELDETEETPK